VILALLEVAAGIFWKEESPLVMTYADDYFFTDSSGITRAVPDGEYRSTSRDTVSGTPIYDVVYKIDALGRRVTDVDDRERRDRFLIFFGCSFTYGEGLDQDETIPFYAGSMDREHVPYNYAFHGHGPAELLVKLQSGALRSEVPESHGTLVYIFIDAHILRTIGSMRIATSWGRNRPFFTIGRDGKIVRKGDFTTGRPVLGRVYRLVAKSRLLRALHVDLPIRITDKEVSFTARILAESERLFREQFPEDRFLVVIYPGSRYGARLAEFLREENVECLDCRGLFSRADPVSWLSPLDQHPSRLANEIMARAIVEAVASEARNGSGKRG
jgi:hypothetical protein